MGVNAFISYGELYDKISILEIKLEKGLDQVKSEYDYLTNIAEQLDEPIYITGFRKALKAINSQC